MNLTGKKINLPVTLAGRLFRLIYTLCTNKMIYEIHVYHYLDKEYYLILEVALIKFILLTFLAMGNTD